MTTIYSLVSIDKECSDCQYINAVSYSKELLQNVIQNIPPEYLHLANFTINQNTPVYSLTTFNDKIILNTLSYNKINPDNLYAFNKITSFKVENTLLDITGYNVVDLRKLDIFKSDLSENNIQFDIFYDEGIMNS